MDDKNKAWAPGGIVATSDLRNIGVNCEEVVMPQ